jgi:HK97 family phage prohead protease
MTNKAERKISGERMFREMRLASTKVDEASRTVEAALSSEQSVERWFGREVLVHTPDAIDLSRADGGLPLLFSHDPRRLIGSVTNLRVEDGKLRGTMTFARNADAAERWQDVVDGHLRSVSIGYELEEWTQEKGSDVVNVTRWTLYEASMVAIPADATVGVGRNHPGDPNMPRATENQDDDLDVDVIERETSARSVAAQNMGAKAERTRVLDIMNRFAPWIDKGHQYVALRDQCIAKNLSPDAAGLKLLELASRGVEAIVSDTAPDSDAPAFEMGSRDERRTLIQPGATHLEQFRKAAALNIAVRAGIASDQERVDDKGSALRGMTLSELAREYLRVIGKSTAGNSREIVQRAFQIRTASGGVSHTSSDFTDILVDSANKQLLRGFTEAPETWDRWARKGSTNDFRLFRRAGLSGFSDLDVVPEGQEYKYGTWQDVQEYAQLKTFGKLFTITRQAIINDDLGAFSTVPAGMGRAAARMVGDEVYNVLINGTSAVLKQDGVALFNTATHKNYVSSGGAAPSVTTLDAGFVAMAIQTDPNGNTLNISPAHLLLPKALEQTGRVLMAAQFDPAGSAGTLKPNPFNGRLQVTADARLDANDSNGWYLAADANQFDTVEAVFLDGNSEPYLEQQDTMTIDGVAFKVRLDVVALPLDYRGLYFNDGE